MKAGIELPGWPWHPRNQASSGSKSSGVAGYLLVDVFALSGGWHDDPVAGRRSGCNLLPAHIRRPPVRHPHADDSWLGPPWCPYDDVHSFHRPVRKGSIGPHSRCEGPLVGAVFQSKRSTRTTMKPQGWSSGPSSPPADAIAGVRSQGKQEQRWVTRLACLSNTVSGEGQGRIVNCKPINI